LYEIIPQLLGFASEVLAYLPYTHMGDVLFIIYHISCITAVEGPQILERFHWFLVKSGLTDSAEYDVDENTCEDILEAAASTSPYPASLQSLAILNSPEFDLKAFSDLCAEASSMVLLFRLKNFLKQSYSISDERLSEYIPNEKEKNSDKILCSPDRRHDFSSSVENSYFDDPASGQKKIRQECFDKTVCHISCKG